MRPHQRSYDVISIFQDGGHGVGNHCTCVRMSKSICTPNFDERYLNPRPSYYYLQFVKTDAYHIGIVLPVSILTDSSSWGCHFASVYRIWSKTVHARRSYDVISIFSERELAICHRPSVCLSSVMQCSALIAMKKNEPKRVIGLLAWA